MTQIKAFFNPQHAGDTFKGLATADGDIADRIIPGLPEFLKAAGRDYFIKKVPAIQRFKGPNGTDEYAEVENQFHLTRSSDDRVVSPHTVTKQYAPLSLMEMAEELQPWCEAGWCQPDGVYSARNESLEMLGLRYIEKTRSQFSDGQEYQHYIIFQNPHGSGGTAKGKIISWRVICANTFAAAVSAKADFAITHRVAAGDPEKQQEIMAERAKEAVEAWEHAREHIHQLSEKINRYNSAPIVYADAENLTDQLLRIADAEDASTVTKNKREAILRGFAMPQFGTFGKTAWDWLNAVTFVNSSPNAEINKKSKVSDIDRMVRNIDINGSGFKLEQRAEELAAAFIS